MTKKELEKIRVVQQVGQPFSGAIVARLHREEPDRKYTFDEFDEAHDRILARINFKPPKDADPDDLLVIVKLKTRAEIKEEGPWK